MAHLDEGSIQHGGRGRRKPIDFAFRVVLCSVSTTFRVEIIQPLDKRSTYAESLRRHGGADHVHHIRLDVSDYQGARERLLGMGHDVALEASFAGAPGVPTSVTATYFATEDDLGFLLLEIADLPAGFSMPEPEQIHPAAGE